MRKNSILVIFLIGISLFMFSSGTLAFFFDIEKTQGNSIGAGSWTSWDKSSLEFTDSGEGSSVWAEITNVGDEGMTGAVSWELYYAPKGPPKNGTAVGTGLVPPLESGESFTMENRADMAGNYMFRANQRPGHPGLGFLWSDKIEIVKTKKPEK
jgi:TasA anchoring/assembly protein